MPNQYLNTNWVCMKILRRLVNRLEVTEYFDRDWEGEFEREFAPGANITVKFPQRFTVTDGMGYQPRPLNRISTTISLDQWLQVAFEWDDYERAVKLERSEEELEENYFDPAGDAFAQEYDSRCAQFAYQNASQVTGVLGTDPTTVGFFYAARRLLKEMACPPGKRGAMISSSAMYNLGAATGAGSIVTMFHPDDEVTRMFKEGSIGKVAGFSAFESNSLWSHTAGHWAGAVTVYGSGQSGTSLVITASAGDTFKVGDKFSVLAVNRVNPMTKRLAGPATVRSFTITQALTAVGGAGADTINFLPPLYGPGSDYQNVDALPLTTAALTLWPGTNAPNDKVGTVGLALSRFAFALVSAKLYLPKAVESAGQARDPDTKIAIRKVKVWDGMRSMEINRMDSLMGTGNLYQDAGAVALACA